MKNSIKVTSDKPDPSPLIRQRGHQLSALYDEAAKKLEPLFADAEEQSFSTLMYLAMHTLHGAYPQLSHDELEALFMGLVKRRRSPVATH